MTEKPLSQDEKITAALAHVTVLLSFWGILAAIAIWVTQKEKSAFVAFQALQVIIYHLASIAVEMVLMALYMCSFFLFIPFSAGAEKASEGAATATPLFFLPFCVFPLFFLAMFGFVGYALYAAWETLQGRDFRYVIIGKRLERYLASKTTTPG